jgi:hypothetical protein
MIVRADSTALRTLYLVTCAGLFAFPVFVAWTLNIDFTLFANESLAYRYFLSERLVKGEPAWIWQGHLLTVIQKGIYAVLNQVLPEYEPNTLHARVQAFSFLTLACASLLMTALLAYAAFSRYIDWVDRALIAVAALAPIYATKAAGFYYSLLPDYFVLNIVLAAGAVVLAARFGRLENHGPITRAVAAGGYGGLLVSNKLTIGIAGVILLPLFLLERRLRLASIVWRAAIAFAAALFVLAFVFLIFTAFDARSEWRLIRNWAIALAASKEDGGFSGAQSLQHFDLYGYDVIIFAWLLAACVTGFHWWHKKDGYAGAMLIASLLGAVALIGFFLKRPAGTTAFDGAIILIALSMAMLTTLPRRRAFVTLIGAVVCAGTLYAALTVPWQHNFHVARSSSVDGRARWLLHSDLTRMAEGRQTIVIFPNNEYHHEGVHEFLLKGAADFPTWNISPSGYDIIRRYAGDLQFRHEYGGVGPNAPYPEDVLLVWFEFPNGPSLPDRYEQLASAVNRQGTTCRKWKIPRGEGVQMYAVGCLTRH